MKTILALLFSFFIVAPVAAQQSPVLYSWAIDPEKTTLSFEGRQQGAPFKGTFGSFTGSIFFHEDHLAESNASIVIDMGSAKTGSQDRDTALPQAVWFDTKNFPQGIYTIKGFEKQADGSYIGRGNLSLRDKTLPLDLPFTLKITKNDAGQEIAHAEGSVTVKRLDFGVGSGEWADESAVGNDVTVTVSLTAKKL